MEASQAKSPARVPAMFEHKATGQAAVKVDGRFASLRRGGGDDDGPRKEFEAVGRRPLEIPPR